MISFRNVPVLFQTQGLAVSRLAAQAVSSLFTWKGEREVGS